jgi:hypothetical protein
MTTINEGYMKWFKKVMIDLINQKDQNIQEIFDTAGFDREGIYDKDSYIKEIESMSIKPDESKMLELAVTYNGEIRKLFDVLRESKAPLDKKSDGQLQFLQDLVGEELFSRLSGINSTLSPWIIEDLGNLKKDRIEHASQSNVVEAKKIEDQQKSLLILLLKLQGGLSYDKYFESIVKYRNSQSLADRYLDFVLDKKDSQIIVDRYLKKMSEFRRNLRRNTNSHYLMNPQAREQIKTVIKISNQLTRYIENEKAFDSESKVENGNVTVLVDELKKVKKELYTNIYKDNYTFSPKVSAEVKLALTMSDWISDKAININRQRTQDAVEQTDTDGKKIMKKAKISMIVSR